MTGFFRKINTLISSQINDVLRPISTDDEGDTPRKKVARDEVKRGLSRDIENLRKRITEAQDYETTLQRRADRLYQEVQRWDTAADQAVADGRQMDARIALEKLQTAQRDLERTKEDLRQHQEVTEELTSKVNYMDYVVHQGDGEEEETPQRTSIPVRPSREEREPAVESEPESTSSVHILGQAPTQANEAPVVEKPSKPAKEDKPKSVKISVKVDADDVAQANESAQAIPVTTTTKTAEQPQEQEIRKRRSKYAKIGDEEYAEGVELAKSITEKLDTTREKLAQLVEENAAVDVPRDVVEDVKQEIDKGQIEDELERRISRLSKPETPPSNTKTE